MRRYVNRVVNEALVQTLQILQTVRTRSAVCTTVVYGRVPIDGLTH